jgi:hypothetical protein
MNDLPTHHNERIVPTFVSPDDSRLQGIEHRDNWYEPRNDAEWAEVTKDQATAKWLIANHKAKMRNELRGRFVHMHKSRRLRKHARRAGHYHFHAQLMNDQNILSLQTGLLRWSARQPVRLMGESEVRLVQVVVSPSVITSLLKDSDL